MSAGGACSRQDLHGYRGRSRDPSAAPVARCTLWVDLHTDTQTPA